MVSWDSTWSFSISYGVSPPQPEEGLGMLLLLGIGLMALSEREKRGGRRW